MKAILHQCEPVLFQLGLGNVQRCHVASVCGKDRRLLTAPSAGNKDILPFQRFKPLNGYGPERGDPYPGIAVTCGFHLLHGNRKCPIIVLSDLVVPGFAVRFVNIHQGNTSMIRLGQTNEMFGISLVPYRNLRTRLPRVSIVDSHDYQFRLIVNASRIFRQRLRMMLFPSINLCHRPSGRSDLQQIGEP